MDLGCGGSRDGDGGGPCGACKFLRRKCVKGCCIFAPYFESSGQGSAHFAAIHKVFGASNASKLLTRIPVHKRLDAVVTLCYEALARATDPVYGCVAHIFSLQQQVVELQAELAYVQARLSILNRISEDPQFQQPQSTSMYFDHPPLQHDQYHPTPFELSNIGNPSYYSYHQELHDQELQDLP
ncbi:LOB domain-containing protein 19-like [Vicia villosa]|uniref:LOB domain-containing protein 19-like n=1 Tax=Vicia villosa TaxID=3911 RepID=UPI00273B7B4A|nr:LOB domain-containing protein 19-like [Vicia villosa]